MKKPDVDRAIAFVRAHGRPLDKARLEYHLYGGCAAAVAGALSAFQNPDGGFRLLEMDLWTDASSPLCTPDVAQMPTPGPSCGRRMAVQRMGSRSSVGWLRLTRGTTASSSRSRSGW